MDQHRQDGRGQQPERDEPLKRHEDTVEDLESTPEDAENVRGGNTWVTSTASGTGTFSRWK